MALGSTMLQLTAIQEIDQDVFVVSEFFAEAFAFLSLGTVVVREIAMEKAGGVWGVNSGLPVDTSNTGFTRLRLLFPDSKMEEVSLLAPSYVSSPAISGAGLAILEITDAAFISAASNLNVARNLGAHAYFDET